ncbi:MAG: DNA translocase FtsK [Bacilli bacterium]
MAKKKKRKETKKEGFDHTEELIGIVLVILAILSIVPKPFGFVGSITASFAMFLIGTGYQILLFAMLVVGCYMIWKKEWPNFFSSRLIGIYCVILGLIVLAHITYVTENKGDVLIIIKETVTNLMSNFNRITHGQVITLKGAGLIGAIFSILFTKLFAVVGAYIVSGVVIVVGCFLVTGISFTDNIKSFLAKFKHPNRKTSYKEATEASAVIVNTDTPVKEPEKTSYTISSLQELNTLCDYKEPSEVELVPSLNSPLETDMSPKSAIETPVNNYKYTLPSVSLLALPKKQKRNNQTIIEKNILALEKVLKDFGITGKVVAVTEGPAVTQYELELNSGTKVSKLLSLNKEISLALAKKDVRIEAPIPGKSTVGIELPNETINMVGLREIMENVPKGKENNKLLVALGKNIMGNPVWCEIDKTPHLLVAGSTGSGKSVCINSIIASILMRTKPDEVKLVLVDPKKVELSMYNGIPHLLMPVVTDPKKANIALQKIVVEMERRYEVFSDHNVKNIATYNEWVDKQNEGKHDVKVPKMVYIVTIVDELADLMMVASKEVEDSIMRITQMARAAGIHLIVATQRPSTDIITGIIKANIPSRISFAVSSSIDSRTILDRMGAEKLLGKGDMLYFPMGEISPVRVQGAYVSDEELQRLVDYTVQQQKAEYDESFTNLTITDGPSMNEVKNAKEEYDDPLYNEIVEFAIMTGKISSSLIQRKYRLGYNRAARIVDLLEERGIIGPSNGSKPREVLIKSDDNDN